MNKLFENIEGNKFKLISESIIEDEPKSSLIRKGIKKVFTEGEKEYSYKNLELVGLGYIRNISEAKKCALQEARELALEFGYRDNEDEQKFVKENETGMSNPEEVKEVQIAKSIIKLARDTMTDEIIVIKPAFKNLAKIENLARELLKIHGQRE